MNINFIITGLTRLGIKPESTATDACALAIRPSELFKVFNRDQRRLCKFSVSDAIVFPVKSDNRSLKRVNVNGAFTAIIYCSALPRINLDWLQRIARTDAI